MRTLTVAGGLLLGLLLTGSCGGEGGPLSAETYFEKLADINGEIADATRDSKGALGDALTTDDASREDLRAALLAALEAMAPALQEGSEALAELEPPEELVDLHDAFVTATASAAEAAGQMAGAIEGAAPGESLRDALDGTGGTSPLQVEQELTGACSALLQIAEETSAETDLRCGDLFSISSLRSARPDPANEGRESPPVPATPGRHRLLFYHDGYERIYFVYVPRSYEGTEPVPLVFWLHGGSHIGLQAETVGFDVAAEEAGAILVAPNGLEAGWNAVHCCGFPWENNIDDVGFVAALTAHVSESLSVDPDRVYVAGGSNGGMLTHRVGTELSDLVAAIAPGASTIGGSPDGESPEMRVGQPSSSVSVIMFHGKRDQKVKYEGGRTAPPVNRVDIGFEESLAFWGQADSCAPDPRVSLTETGSVTRYTGCADLTEVVGVTVDDLGHGYPTVENSGVDGARMAVEFFLDHPK
ncbi:MAG: alpha/beta hydrolase family esterase [Dehalococcoidia bacterium]